MIRTLTGRISVISEDGVIVETGGVGYHLICSARQRTLWREGETAMTIWVETIFRDDSIRLFGFASNEERVWFCALTRVQGVGPNLALALLSALEPEDIARAISFDDTASLTAAPGVGQRIARRIISELRESMPETTPISQTAFPAKDSKTMDSPAAAISALINLGYAQADALAAVRQAQQTSSEDSQPVEHIIRASLRILAG